MFSLHFEGCSGVPLGVLYYCCYYYFFWDDHSSVLLFFQIPLFPLRLYLSFSLLKASVWFLRCSPALSLCPLLSRWPAAVLLHSIPLSSTFLQYKQNRPAQKNNSVVNSSLNLRWSQLEQASTCPSSYKPPHTLPSVSPALLPVSMATPVLNDIWHW